ncbi:hypothetical protein [Nocardioides stalactiti]|uniref:hypothetical protein n=1 Tax=Nocardioides stalactiti TaxID=2755356 RepID=UPI00160299F9|nr:hypothetical protein [Nocardioides stalactiti]
MTWTPQHSQNAMIAVGGGVGAAAMVAPALLQRVFGIPAEEITGPGLMGWRLFAARNLYLTARAAQGDSTAIAAFGHLQALDQVVFWHAFSTRSVPRSTAVLAAATSLAIVALDVHRRTSR